MCEVFSYGLVVYLLIGALLSTVAFVGARNGKDWYDYQNMTRKEVTILLAISSCTWVFLLTDDVYRGNLLAGLRRSLPWD